MVEVGIAVGFDLTVEVMVAVVAAIVVVVVAVVAVVARVAVAVWAVVAVGDTVVMSAFWSRFERFMQSTLILGVVMGCIDAVLRVVGLPTFEAVVDVLDVGSLVLTVMSLLAFGVIIFRGCFHSSDDHDEGW